MEPDGSLPRPSTMKTTTILTLATAVLVSAAACVGADGGQNPTDDHTIDPATVTVTVDWTPPSTQDQYENTESLTLSRDGAEHQVRDDDPTTTPIDAQRWQAFVDDLPAALDEIGEQDQDDPCVGAGGSSLTVTGTGEYDRAVTTTICGGKQSSQAQRIDALVADFR